MSSLLTPLTLAVDSVNNVYVMGTDSDNVFKIEPNGAISEVIDGSRDGAGNTLDRPRALAVDSANNVYVAGSNSSNVFKTTPIGAISEIIDVSGDGAGNTLDRPQALAVDSANNVYVSDSIFSNHVFRISPGGQINEVIGSPPESLLDPCSWRSTPPRTCTSRQPIRTMSSSFRSRRAATRTESEPRCSDSSNGAVVERSGGAAGIGEPCVLSISVRRDFIGLFRPALNAHAWMIHPIDTEIQTRSGTRSCAGSRSC